MGNLHLTSQAVFLWSARCDKIAHISMELDMLLSNKVFCEQSYIDVERVFHSIENFKKMRKTLDSLSSHPFFDKVHESPREKK